MINKVFIMERLQKLYEIQLKRNKKLNAELVQVRKRMIKAETCLRLLKKLPVEFKEKEDE